MIIEELFSKLVRKHGEEFHWLNIKDKQEIFIKELYSELNENHPLYKVKIANALARSGANDDVLFLLEDGSCIIVHLTWSKTNISSFPHYIEFSDLQTALKHIEDMFTAEYTTA